jgi:hypothetical protein
MLFQRTEKIKELSLAWMRPVLEHCGFSQSVEFLVSLMMGPDLHQRFGNYLQAKHSDQGSQEKLVLIKIEHSVHSPTSGRTNISVVIEIV